MEYEEESTRNAQARLSTAHLAAVWIISVYCTFLILSLVVARYLGSYLIDTELSEGPFLWTSKNRHQKNPRTCEVPQADCAGKGKSNTFIGNIAKVITL